MLKWMFSGRSEPRTRGSLLIACIRGPFPSHVYEVPPQCLPLCWAAWGGMWALTLFSRTCLQNLDKSTDCPEVLLRCRFWFRKTGMGPRILHFWGAPRLHHSYWPKKHTLSGRALCRHWHAADMPGCMEDLKVSAKPQNTFFRFLGHLFKGRLV